MSGNNFSYNLIVWDTIQARIWYHTVAPCSLTDARSDWNYLAAHSISDSLGCTTPMLHVFDSTLCQCIFFCVGPSLRTQVVPRYWQITPRGTQTALAFCSGTCNYGNWAVVQLFRAAKLLQMKCRFFMKALWLIFAMPGSICALVWYKSALWQSIDCSVARSFRP